MDLDQAFYRHLGIHRVEHQIITEHGFRVGDPIDPGTGLAGQELPITINISSPKKHILWIDLAILPADLYFACSRNTAL